MLKKIRQSLFNSIRRFSSISICLLYSGTSAALEPLQLEMVVVREHNSRWSLQDIDDTLARTNTVLQQCSIYIVKAKVIQSELVDIPLGYETSPFSLKIYNDEHMPVLLLLNGVDYKSSAGLSPGPSAVFLSYYSRSDDYIKARAADYNTLAHELGHMLGGLQHIQAQDQKNLMAGYLDRQSDHLTVEQCHKMREHKDLKPKKNDE